MYDWKELDNGNLCCFEFIETVTVFERGGSWRGIKDGYITDPYDSSEAAIDAIESETAEWIYMNTISGWKTNKKGGGQYKQHRGSLCSVKRSKTGSYYVSINQTLWKGQWFNSIEEAKQAVDEYLCMNG